jgi:acetate kinase
MTDVLVVNAGSMSLKLHRVDDEETVTPVPQLADVADAPLAAIVHRVVHGGARFREPIVIDARVRAAIFALEAVDPIHNAPALRAIERAKLLLPEIPEIAVFDTGFHTTLPDEVCAYAVPTRWRTDWGVRRFGFHGLSLAWCAERVPVPRLVVCHLGGGCSVTAIADGRSVDTSMGFSPLDGLPGTSRSGAVDPQALIFALRTGRVALDALEHDLNFASGLVALGGSADMRIIEAQDGLALKVFVHRLAAGIAAMTASLGGLDALVFTAGIGEGSVVVRERVCARLGFLGIAIDADRNRRAVPDTRIDAPGAAVAVHVIRTRQELVAARAARRLLGDGSR